MARPRPSLPVLVLVVVALVAGALIAFAVVKERGTPTGAASDAAMNQKIIDRLQPYPGARQTRKFVRESYGGYGGGLLPGQADESHITTIVYSMPAKPKRKLVADFYARQLPGWKRDQGDQFVECASSGFGGPCFASFTKGDAAVSLTFARRNIFLDVDAHGAARSSDFGD